MFDPFASERTLFRLTLGPVGRLGPPWPEPTAPATQPGPGPGSRELALCPPRGHPARYPQTAPSVPPAGLSSRARVKRLKNRPLSCLLNRLEPSLEPTRASASSGPKSILPLLSLGVDDGLRFGVP